MKETNIKRKPFKTKEQRNLAQAKYRTNTPKVRLDILIDKDIKDKFDSLRGEVSQAKFLKVLLDNFKQPLP